MPKLRLLIFRENKLGVCGLLASDDDDEEEELMWRCYRLKSGSSTWVRTGTESCNHNQKGQKMSSSYSDVKMSIARISSIICIGKP